MLDTAAASLKSSNIEDIPGKAAAFVKQAKDDSKKIESLEAKLASNKINGILTSAVDVNGVKVAVAEFDSTSADELRKMTDTIKAENDDVVAVFASVNGEKLTFCAGAGKRAIARGAHAGNIVKAVAQIAGGNGGGKPDSAMAGGKECDKVQAALDAVCQIVSGMVK